jgi:hypothetical protein
VPQARLPRRGPVPVPPEDFLGLRALLLGVREPRVLAITRLPLRREWVSRARHAQVPTAADLQQRVPPLAAARRQVVVQGCPACHDPIQR